MAENVAEQWLGEKFLELHPLLQDLHRRPGLLSGQVEVSFGPGLAGVIGRRTAARLGVPSSAGQHRLEVSIYSENGVLHWLRSFNGLSQLHSEFRPVGRYPTGHWVERSGLLTLILGVDVLSGAWHWVHKGTRLLGIPLPQALVPTTLASKSIDQGLYRFSVQVRAPVLGKLFAYSGALALNR